MTVSKLKEIVFYSIKPPAQFLTRLGLGRIGLMRKIHDFFFFFLMPVKIHGQQLYLTNSWSEQTPFSIYHSYEMLSVSVVKKHLKKGDIAIDIGAHVGIYTLLFAKLVGRKGHVYSFEPDPHNLALLKKNIKLNGYKNITVFGKAVSDRLGKTELYLSQKNSLDHRIYKINDHQVRVRVSTIKLDDIPDLFKKRLDLVKIDIQGTELLALKGMVKLLRRNKNVKMIVEYWPKGQIQFGLNPKDVLNWLESNNFNLFEIDEASKSLVETNSSKLLKKYRSKEKKYTNILCIKNN